LLLAAATLGFLPWNLPSARIFLGDVGSGFLGFMLAAFVVAMSHVNPSLGLAWGILPGLFIADATVTLLRRAIRGERIFEAHRSHAYQKLARSLKSHRPVTIIYLAATACWLVPIAQLASDRQLDPIVALAVAWLPVFGLALALGSGRPDRAASGDARKL
jgi:Fuc2NAc and GlcNAc transferase